MNSAMRVRDKYYNWLCDKVRISQDNKSYWLLAKHLHEKEFRWFIPNDDNRACEGRNLREIFCDTNDIEYVFDDFPYNVSMLELLIALAYRCQYIMDDLIEDANMDICDWFWVMVTNAGFDRFNDDAYTALRGEVIVEQILNRIIDRTYLKDGGGGLFPMVRNRRDQRKVELWYQMNEYLVENYCDNFVTV